MKTTTTALLALVLLAAPSVPAQAPVRDFSLPSALDGSLIRLSDHAGKVVLLNWWRTSCGLCHREVARLKALREKHADRGFEIIGIADESSKSVKDVPAFVERYGVSWPVGLMDQAEFRREVRSKGSGSTPGNYVVSRDGKLTWLGLDRGEEQWRKLEAAVERLLAEPAPEQPAIRPRALAEAPPFELEDLHGDTVRLGDFRGEPMIVHFFTTKTAGWTGDLFGRLHRSHGPKGLRVVGINLYGKDPAVRAAMEKHGMTYPVLRGDRATHRAWVGSSKAWAVFFVTADGRIFKKIVHSLVDGIEPEVFTRYADHLVAARATVTRRK